MYLKSLKLVGFKSFADRTRLEFRPGITAIVGPNGAGKSNIVDALAWVMGTQAPSSLRGERMDDLIFAGTATRTGLGRAEVTLVLDNRSGALPIDLSEISITRRLYRDGSSDYEINGVECRLLDVQELLSDSGVGRHQHLIVGQGQIDAVLNADPEDHRMVIEEAAGILKHRLRKDKALRRMAHTDGDVLRLEDLLTEIGRRLRPLERQAKAATRHSQVVDEIRTLRLYLAGGRLRELQARALAVAAEEAERSVALSDTEPRVSELESELSILSFETRSIVTRLDRDTEAAGRIETTIERLRRIASVAHERHRAARDRLEGADERRRDLVAEFELLQVERVRGEDDGTATLRAVTLAEMEFRRAEEEERSLTDQEGMPTEGKLAVVRGELRSLTAADDRDRHELAAIDRRLAGLSSQTESEQAESIGLVEEIRAIDTRLAGLETEYAATVAARTGEQQLWETAETADLAVRLELAAARARFEALGEAGGAEPAGVEARKLMESARGALGAVSDRLDVPGELAAAIEAALAPWADSIVFGDQVSLEEAVGSLKRSGWGGMAALKHQTAGWESPEHDDAGRARAVAAEWGLEALVDRFGPRCDQSLAMRLLGDVVLAEGWSVAVMVVARYPGLRAVTPEGDLVTAAGIRVARPDGATAGMFPGMLKAAGEAVDAAGIQAARAASLLVQTRRGFEVARRTEREALETLERREVELAGATEALARLDRSRAGVADESQRLEDRRAAIVAAATDRTERRRRLSEQLASLEGAEVDRQRVWDEATALRRRLAEGRELTRAAWQEASSTHRGVVERGRMVKARIETLGPALAIEPSIDPDRIERMASIERAARQAVEALGVHLAALRQRQADLRRLRSVTVSRHDQLEAITAQHRQEMAAARDRGGELAVEAAELRVRLESVAEALRRDLDAHEDTALATPRPDTGGEDPATLLAVRESELRRMGLVNPLAAEEYAVLAERHEFLRAQLDDLQRSRGELRRIIQALDSEIEARFVAAFAEISAAYQQHSEILFPGGVGRLRLTDPAQVLTSGVEIEAQPMGKKVTKMSLLSGGERSLAALAFLFSVFRARPSPFYVLDEVEAALDDTNLRRFLRLLDAFRRDAQLIVVTHQQQTIETADILYGVTMEPGGSSQVLVKVMTPGRAEVSAWRE